MDDSELDFGKIVESTSDIAAVLKLDGSIHWVSTSIENLCGWQPSEIRDANWHTLVHPNDYDTVRAAWNINQHQNGRFEHRLRTKDGGFRWFRTLARRITGSNGHTFVVLGLHDIDDDIRQRENSRWSEIGLRKLFDDIPDPVVVWTPVRNEHGQLIDLRARKTNRVYDGYFGGYSPEGRLATAFTPTVLRMLPRIEELIRTGGSTSFTYSADPAAKYHIHLSLTGFGDIAMVVRDISDLTGEEDRPESLADISERVKHLARMAHTLRTNLSVVQGWTELLEEADLDSNPELRQEAINSIARNTKRLVETVNLLMDAASNDGNGYEIAVRSVDIAEQLLGIAEDTRVLHPHLTIDVEIHGELRAHGEAAAVDTVIRHLVENACRFARSKLAIIGRKTSRSVDISIKDDGPGIDGDVELFRPFTPNHHGEGHGLGLNVVATLVEALNGAVRGGNRTDGQGAEFVVSLSAIMESQTESMSR